MRTDAGEFYLVPGEGTICRIGGAAMACGSSAHLSDQPLGHIFYSRPASISHDEVIVSGIAADNVRQVTAVQPDGRRLDVTIAGNAYATAIPSATARIEIRTIDQGLLSTAPPEPMRN